jgi:hypothetical protein
MTPAAGLDQVLVPVFLGDPHRTDRYHYTRVGERAARTVNRACSLPARAAAPV